MRHGGETKKDKSIRLGTESNIAENADVHLPLIKRGGGPGKF